MNNDRQYFILAALNDFFRSFLTLVPSISSVEEDDAAHVSIGTIGVKLSGWTK